MRSLSVVALMHFVTSAIVLWLGYYWLSVPESRAGTLAWSAAVALFMVLAMSWSCGSSLAFFGESEEPRAVRAWRESLRHLLPFALAVVFLIVVYWLLTLWAGYSAKPVFRVASFLTLKLRRPVRPASVQRVFDAMLWLVRWMAIPALVLPVLSAIAKSGWRGFGPRAKNWLYWIETAILLFCAVRLPLLLLHWVPRVGGFTMQAASFAVRSGVAYLLFVAAWLVLALVTSDGKPRVTQASTVASP